MDSIAPGLPPIKYVQSELSGETAFNDTAKQQEMLGWDYYDWTAAGDEEWQLSKNSADAATAPQNDACAESCFQQQER